MTELLPCPFCGEQPRITPELDYKKGGEKVPDSVIISCERGNHDVGTRDFKPLNESIQAWNTRSDNWQPIETIPIDDACLVYLEKPMLGSNTHVKSNAITIGGIFAFEAPNVIAWQPLPQPPNSKE